MNDLKYSVAISLLNKIGSKKFQQLNNYFPNFESAWKASSAEWQKAGIEARVAEEFNLRRNEINPDEEWEKLEKENVQIVTLDDSRYPRLLKEIYNPPFLLYYKGNLANLTEQTIAIVGTRKISNYGKQATEQISAELIDNNIIIVSGLALGVDSLAHLTATKKQKTTIAVLGSGLDSQNIYPAINRSLARDIVENNGILISEYPIGTMPLRHNFPMRNRIISGLSLGTLVIEAGQTSGALITAKFALEQNREVFAVPGSIASEFSIGTNNLIKNGAKLVMNANDIFEELNLSQLTEFQNNRQIIPDSPQEATLLKHLFAEPLHVNELVKLSKMPITEVNSTLMILEMKGRVKNLGNMTYIAAK
ncbi:DNA-processing protein DprA [Patescibacteria group bacterium]|nr:DNA-processing protein DprA [Patescibacteria group bacterium]